MLRLQLTVARQCEPYSTTLQWWTILRRCWKSIFMGEIVGTHSVIYSSLLLWREVSVTRKVKICMQGNPVGLSVRFSNGSSIKWTFVKAFKPMLELSTFLTHQWVSYISQAKFQTRRHSHNDTSCNSAENFFISALHLNSVPVSVQNMQRAGFRWPRREVCGEMTFV